MRKIVLLMLIVVGVTSCETLKKIDEGTKAITSYSLSDISQGAVVYKVNCAKCHALPKTGDYTVAQWEPILNNMLNKSNITDPTLRAQAFAYVNTNAKRIVNK